MRKFLLTAIAVFFPLLSMADMPARFMKVSEGVYRGGRPTDAQLTELAARGIKIDINLQGGDGQNWLFGALARRSEPGENQAVIEHERATASQLGVGFLNTPLDCLSPISRAEDEQIERVLSLLEKASAKTPVYLHCEHGKDRTGLVIALYRVRHDHWSAQAAFAEWEQIGHSDLNQLMFFNLDQYFWRKVRGL